MEGSDITEQVSKLLLILLLGLFTLLLQHMADCYKALFADKLICASASVAITHLANECKRIPALRKNINTVTMLAGDVLLCHFRKGMYHGRIGSCTLLSLMYSCCRAVTLLAYHFCTLLLHRLGHTHMYTNRKHAFPVLNFINS